MKIPGVFDFSVSRIGADGTQYFTGMTEPERLDSRGLRCGNAFSINLDHKRQITEIYKFRWIGGAPHDFELIARLKGEIIEEPEILPILKKYKLIDTAETA